MLLVVSAVLLTAAAYGCGVEPVRADIAAGDASCVSCHRDKATFETTAHRLTSRVATRASISGSFAPQENVLRTSNPDLVFRMDSTADGFFETALTGRGKDTSSRRVKLAIVIGSGRKGQTYLNWRLGDQLLELPVSYWKGIGWINSPGYQDGVANFDRPVDPRCLECHATFFESIADPEIHNRYRPSSAILGVTCETCHGAGKTHARVARIPGHQVLPRSIVSPKQLTRAQQLDQCALCHNGAVATKTPAFTYVAGQPIADHLELRPAPPNADVDVHGNQVALLERSRCFRESQMTCTTCHDVHRPQRNVAALSTRCLTCHTAKQCGLYARRGDAILGKCVDCHMPLQTSNVIISTFEGRQERPQVRTHWIKVYPLADTTTTRTR